MGGGGARVGRHARAPAVGRGTLRPGDYTRTRTTNEHENQNRFRLRFSFWCFVFVDGFRFGASRRLARGCTPRKPKRKPPNDQRKPKPETKTRLTSPCSPGRASSPPPESSSS